MRRRKDLEEEFGESYQNSLYSHQDDIIEHQPLISTSSSNQNEFEKSHSPYRWVILLLGCLMMVGLYYCFDIAAALKTRIDDYLSHPKGFEMGFGLFYSLYAIPNIFLPLFGGYLVDKMGILNCLMLFGSFICLGQIIFTLGLTAKSWPLMYLGRLIFGLGGESYTVANSALLAEWFKGKELALAFGVNLSISRVGSVINNILSPVLARKVHLLFAMWFGSILCIVSMVCVVSVYPFEEKVGKKIKDIQSSEVGGSESHAIATGSGNGGYQNQPLPPKKPSKSIESDANLTPTNTVLTSSITVHDLSQVCSSSIHDIYTLPFTFWILVGICMVTYGAVIPFNNISSSLLLERDYFKAPPSNCHLMNPWQCQSKTNPPVAGLCPINDMSYQPPLPHNYSHYNPLKSGDIDCANIYWQEGCTQEYCSRFNAAETQASYTMSIPYIVSAVLSPPLGYFIDIFGYHAIIATMAPACLIIAHLQLALTSIDPVWPLIGQGFAYTAFASVAWPAIPLIVEKRIVGLAFGFGTCLANLACAIFPIIVARLYTLSNHHYLPNVEYMFASLGVIGVLIGLVLIYYDDIKNVHT